MNCQRLANSTGMTEKEICKAKKIASAKQISFKVSVLLTCKQFKENAAQMSKVSQIG